MKLNIIRKDLFATVETRGAIIDVLNHRQESLLYPRKDDFGGLLPAFPYYGEAPDRKGLRHGYAAWKEWDIESLLMDRVVLTLPRGEGIYEETTLTASYQLTEHGLKVSLAVVNRGEKALPVAPGFHMLLQTDKGEWSVRANDEVIATKDLEGMVFQQDLHSLKLRRRSFRMESDNLPLWSLWTDREGEYLACDPTLAGVSFFKEDGRHEMLKPGQRRVYRLQVALE